MGMTTYMECGQAQEGWKWKEFVQYSLNGKSVKEVNQDPPMLVNDKGVRKSDQVYLYNADF